MNNLNLGYGLVLPAVNELRVNPSAGEGQVISEQNYLPLGQGISGVPLNQRAVMSNTAPVCYQNHSYGVGALLQQRSYLDYQYQKIQALAACMRGTDMVGQLPQLQHSLQGHGQIPQLRGGDLLYQPLAGSPVSFSHYTNRLAPQVLQSALPSIMSASSCQAEMKGTAECQRLQPLINGYGCSLNRLLQHNSQQLSFQGYSTPPLSPAVPVAYPFEQLQQWLGTPQNQPATPLTGYPVNKLSQQQRSSLYFIPEADAFNPDQFVPNSDTKTIKELETHSLWSMLKQRIESFQYPGKPLGYEQGTVSSPCFSVLQNTASLETALDNQQQREPLISRGYEVAADKGIVLTAEANSRLSSPEEVKNSPLGWCIEFMENQTLSNNGAISRKRLTTLFDSWEGQVLFGNRDHSQGRSLLSNNANHPGNYASDNISVDISSTLKFIDLYSKAVAVEQKSGITELPRHRRKKLERLAALKEIRQFVEGLSSKKPDTAALCRLALQMCGRVRERSLVNQHQLGLCGGFTVIQNAWGEKPLMTARVLLNLASYHRCRVKTLIAGKDKELRVPSIDLSRFSDTLADKLLLSTLYDLNRDSSTAGRDAVNASFLGVSARPFNQDRWLKENDSLANSAFIEAMCQASQQKCHVRGAVTGKLRKHLHSVLRGGLERKANKYDVLDIESGVNQTNDSDKKGHAVIFDSFKVEGDRVVFKLYSWGRVYHLKMKQHTFLQHINKTSFVVFNQSTATDKNSIFNDIDIEETDTRGDSQGIILSLSGEEKSVPEGTTVKGFSGKNYTYKGNGSWSIASPRQ